MKQAIYRFLFSLMLVVGLGACVGLKPRPDKMRTYVLGPLELLEPEQDLAMPIYIERPDLPAYSTGNRFVIRDKNGRTSSLDDARWAEMLPDTVSRALGEWVADQSGRRLGGYYPWPKMSNTLVSVRVQFQQFVATADGRILVSAQWQVSAEGVEAKSGGYLSENIVWQPDDPESIVSGYNQALRELAALVADAFQ
ncbi:PqiC family protein [Coraliomargarita parva]|uniref:PqiC family protein n=1 Tax=Coraliomargarita parva TaxID=3014050 RepID=UPI0022B34403|nr:ABC-type transport auxiliary lipoprotein family protein [Coraliomargarita parva]